MFLTTNISRSICQAHQPRRIELPRAQAVKLDCSTSTPGSQGSLCSSSGSGNRAWWPDTSKHPQSWQQLYAALAAAVCIWGAQQPAAWAKPALLDLPACNKFKDAGAIKDCEVSSGGGDSPLAGDLIVVDYTARAVATGKVYDGSRNFKFTVGQEEVIPGWEQGILGNDYIPAIKEGGARTLLVPPELAYGSTGDGCLFGLPDSCRIPPNSPVEITFKYRGLGY